MYYCTCLSCETKRETSVNQNLTIWGTNSKLVISDSSILVLRNFWSRWFFRWNTMLLRLFRDGGSNSCKRGSGITNFKTSNFRYTWSNLRPLLEVRAGPTRLCTSRKGPARISGCHIWPWHLFPFSVRDSHCSESPHGERRVLVLRCAATAHLPAAALLRRLLDLKTISLKA